MLSPYDPAVQRPALDVDWREVTVTAASPLQVQDGTGIPVACRNGMPNWRPAVGDRLLVQRMGRELVAIQSLTTRPPRGTVVSVAGQVASISAAGRLWDLSYIGAAPPVGATVRILWDADGGTVLGTVGGATAAPDRQVVQPLPVAQLVSLDARPIGWSTYRGGAPLDGETDRVGQGYWAGYGYLGFKSGLWVYGDVFGGVRGRSCQSLSIDLTRLPGIGISAARTVHLQLHNHRTLPGSPAFVGAEYTGASIAAGASGTYPLPTSWGDQMAAGTAAGVGISYAGDADYMALHGPTVAGSGTLHATYL